MSIPCGTWATVHEDNLVFVGVPGEEQVKASFPDSFLIEKEVLMMIMAAIASLVYQRN